MGRERTLLQRLADGGVSPRSYQPTAQEDVEKLMESVRDHLQCVLNSRHQMSECLPDYGLPALSDLTVGVSDYVRLMQTAVQDAVEKYEPRLRNVRVNRVLDDDHGRTLSFRIEGVLVGRQGEHRVWYETSLDGEGQFDVSG